MVLKVPIFASSTARAKAPKPSPPEIVEFDYSTMSLDDKAKIDAGAQALINAAESQQ